MVRTPGVVTLEIKEAIEIIIEVLWQVIVLYCVCLEKHCSRDQTVQATTISVQRYTKKMIYIKKAACKHDNQNTY